MILFDSEISDAQVRDISKGETVFSAGDPCKGLPIVLAGEICIYRNYSNGRDLELYRIVPRDICVLSIAMLIGKGVNYPVYCIATKQTKMAMLPAKRFTYLLAHAPSFRQQVFSDFSERLLTVIGLVNSIIDRTLDQRLAVILLLRGPILTQTHQQLAQEIGSVREVVSRILARFSQLGWVELRRMHIEVKNITALKIFSESQD